MMIPPGGTGNAVAGISALGRSTDSQIAHVTPGEMIVPREFMQNPQVAMLLQQVFKSARKNPAEFIVGSSKAKINPQSGAQEFFLGEAGLALSDPAAAASLGIESAQGDYGFDSGPGYGGMDTSDGEVTGYQQNVLEGILEGLIGEGDSNIEDGAVFSYDTQPNSYGPLSLDIFGGSPSNPALALSDPAAAAALGIVSSQGNYGTQGGQGVDENDNSGNYTYTPPNIFSQLENYMFGTNGGPPRTMMGPLAPLALITQLAHKAGIPVTEFGEFPGDAVSVSDNGENIIRKIIEASGDKMDQNTARRKRRTLLTPPANYNYGLNPEFTFFNEEEVPMMLQPV